MKKFNKYTVIGMLLGVLILLIGIFIFIKIGGNNREENNKIEKVSENKKTNNTQEDNNENKIDELPNNKIVVTENDKEKSDCEDKYFDYTYEYTSYDTSDEFKQIAEVGNKTIEKDITNESNISEFKEWNIFNRCIVINNENEFKNSIEDPNLNRIYNIENDINISKEEWKNNTLVVLPYYNYSVITDLKVTEIEYNEENVNIKISSSEGAIRESTLSRILQNAGPIYIDKETNKAIEYTQESNAKLLYIMINKIDVDKTVNYEIKTYDAKKIKESRTSKVYEASLTTDKPIIYLYPEKETEVSVKVGYPEKLTVTYPKYENGWDVMAKPNGDLIDIKTGRNLYSLYWEGKNTSAKETNEGFLVKGEDTAKFLEEKLAILGLTEREAEEFIVYWLPQMQNNKYNFIRFETKEEIDENMPLNITPTPNTVIRVVMEFKPLDNKIEIKEQSLPETPVREGFTVVEWGGTKIK